MINKLLKILFSTKNFSPPQRSEILIIDNIFIEIIKKLLNKKKLSFLDVRLQELNFYILFKVLFSKKKNTFFNYVVEFINFTQCKYVITANDNLLWFYKLKKIFPYKNFLIIQNGFREKIVLKHIKQQKSASDYIFVFSNSYANKFKKSVKAKIIVIGSLKNNFINKVKKKNKRKSILFIGTGFPKTKMFTGNGTGNYSVLSEKFYQSDIILAKRLGDYCEKLNLNLEIASKHRNSKEANYYKQNLKGTKYIYHGFNRSKSTSYEIADQVLATVSSHSTLGPESLARGNRTAIFNNKKKMTKGILDVFWSSNIKSKGPFWSDDINLKEINRVLNFVLFSDDRTWKKRTNHLINKLMAYDPQNNKLKTFFKNLNNVNKKTL